MASDSITWAEIQLGGSEGVSPFELAGRHVENAREQLADARERLKAARRRVVELEGVLGNWERLLHDMRGVECFEDDRR